MRHTLFSLVMCTLLFFYTGAANSTQNLALDNSQLNQDQEFRALFDEDFFWLSKEGAEQLVKKAKNSGFNVIIPCVWHGRGVSWPSKLAAREPKWKRHMRYKNPDPLRYLIKIAHENKIEVHPWFTVLLKQRDFFSHLAKGMNSEKSFNLFNEDYKTLITNLVTEVATNYDIDGINLDYVRFFNICDTEFCKNDYKSKFKRNLEHDLLTRRISSTSDIFLTKWKVDAVTAIVAEISKSVRKIKPKATISVDTLANDVKWKTLGANGVEWANAGIVDIVFHMDYGEKLNTSFINKAREKFDDKNKLIVLVGNFKFTDKNNTKPVPLPPETVSKLIESARSLRANNQGYALYEYRFLTDEQIPAIKAKNFSN